MQLQAQGPEPRGDGGQQLVFADEGHSGATLVRPGPGGAARPGRPGLPGRVADAAARRRHPAAPARPGPPAVLLGLARRRHQHRARQAHRGWNAYAETAP
jgi:hypothetical protein